MLKIFLIFFVVTISYLTATGQPEGLKREGNVSFISSANVYVKFLSTENLHPGDTLYIEKEQSFVPALQVTQISSISCICKPLADFQFLVTQKIFAFPKVIKLTLREVKKAEADTVRQNTIPTPVSHSNRDRMVKGRLALSSYTNLTGANDNNNTRFRYNLKLDIGNSQSPGFSAESYLVYTHKLNNNHVPDGLRIYNLALHYNLCNSINFWIGRKISERISNVGAVDGLQVEAKNGDFYIGLAGGFKPGYHNYEFNKSLFQYGGWIGHHHQFNTGSFVASTLSFFEQKYHGKTDRRFVYIQHDNSILKNLNIFLSTEIDLYRIENNLPVNSVSLTSFYLSLQYKFSRKLSVKGSFDQRKNVVYYETFRSFGDSLFEAATRKGLQVRTIYRPAANFFIGINAGHQFGDNDIRSTNNVSANLSILRIPGLNGSGTISANMVGTNYLDGKSAGLKIEKELLEGKVLISPAYKYNHYQFRSSLTKIQEHVAELDLRWEIFRTLALNLDIERAFTDKVDYSNVYINLIKHF